MALSLAQAMVSYEVVSYCCIYYLLLKVKVKEDIAVMGTPISQLWDITCHMRSQCYLPPDTSERSPS